MHVTLILEYVSEWALALGDFHEVVTGGQRRTAHKRQ